MIHKDCFEFEVSGSIVGNVLNNFYGIYVFGASSKPIINMIFFSYVFLYRFLFYLFFIYLYLSVEEKRVFN